MGIENLNDRARLVYAIENLNDRARTAFVVAGRKSVIKRGTWDGCAFNAGSKIYKDRLLPLGVTSFREAAQHFGLDQHIVANFIAAWDASRYYMSSDEEATKFLVQTCLEYGVNEDLLPEYPKPKKFSELKIRQEKVYENKEWKKFDDELQKMLNDETNADVQKLCADVDQALVLIS